jgi:hypothetical protein
LRVVVERLAMEDEDRVLVERRADRPPVRLVERAGEVDTPSTRGGGRDP